MHCFLVSVGNLKSIFFYLQNMFELLLKKYWSNIQIIVNFMVIVKYKEIITKTMNENVALEKMELFQI